jgi:rhamnose transport system substrate-binding protein
VQYRRTAASGAIVLALAATVLTGCADGTGGGTDGGTAASCADGPVTVGFVNKLDTDPYWGETKNGAEDAKADFGGDLVITAPSKDTGDAQLEFINSLIAQNVGAIVIAGNNPDTVAPALKRAAEAGIPVLSYDSDVAVDARTLFVNQANLGDLGTQLIDAMADQIGNEGQIAALIDNATATNQVQWVDAIKEAIATNPDYSGIELVTTVYGESNETTSQQQALALVNAYPDLKGIIAPSGLGYPAVARALDSAGLTDKIKLTGLAPASIMKKYVLSGQATVVWWNVHDLGYLAYAAAQALAQCQVDGSEGQTLDAGDLGEYTVGADGEIILGPAELVTAENVDDFAF